MTDKISLLCTYDSNNELQINLSQNLDTLETSDKSLVVDAVEDIIGAMDDFLSEIAPENLKGLVDNSAFVIEVGYDFASNIKEAKETYGEDGYKAELITIGKAIVSYGFSSAGSTIAKTLFSATPAGKIAGAVVGGIVASGVYESYLEQPIENFLAEIKPSSWNIDFSDSSQNVKTAVGYENSDSSGVDTDSYTLLAAQSFTDFILSYGLGSGLSDYSISDFEASDGVSYIAVPDSSNSDYANFSIFESAIKSALEDQLQQSTTLGSVTSSFLTSLTQAEATQPVYRRDPLTLDLDGDGIDLVSLSNSSTFFDLDNDGLREQVGWVGADDGLLVYDSNNNSSVDNVTELFGYENEDGTEVSGTEELRTYDLNSDGVINGSDAIFSNLQVWQDADQDGLTDSGELKYLSDLNISSINLNDTTASNQNVNGNVILSTGSYNTETTTETTSTITNEDGTTSEVTSTTTTTNSNQFANLNLAINQTNSSAYEYTDSDGNTVSYDLNLETLTLPFSRGYGNTKAWHIAMSEDDTLLTQVKNITNFITDNYSSSSSSSSNDVTYENLDSKIEDFIYRLTGTENVSGMRGSFDARKLSAMEELRGVDYVNAFDGLISDEIDFAQNLSQQNHR